MNITIPCQGAVYNCRVSANVIYRDEFLFEIKDMVRFPLGGPLQFGETIEDTLRKQLKKEFELEIIEASFTGIGEGFFISELDGSTVHEHNFIMDIKVDDEHELITHRDIVGMSDDEIEISDEIVPIYWKDVVKAEDFDFYSDLSAISQLNQTTELELIDENQKIFSVKTSAIIRKDSKVLLEKMDDVYQLIEMNQAMDETILNTLEKTLNKSLGISVEESFFVGVSEDIELSDLTQHHCIRFIFEVDAKLPAKLPSNYEWVEEKAFETLNFNGHEVKEILQSISLD